MAFWVSCSCLDGAPESHERRGGERKKHNEGYRACFKAMKPSRAASCNKGIKRQMVVGSLILRDIP